MTGDEETTPWLDAGEQAAWRAYLNGMIRVQTEIERALRRVGVSHTYYEILVRLSEAPDRQLRMSVLAESSASSRSRLSHAVARLEEQGLVRRADCPDDRRGQLCQLTEAGFATLEGVAPAHVRSVRSVLLDALTPEQLAVLGSLSSVIIAHLDGRASALD